MKVIQLDSGIRGVPTGRAPKYTAHERRAIELRRPQYPPGTPDPDIFYDIVVGSTREEMVANRIGNVDEEV